MADNIDNTPDNGSEKSLADILHRNKKSEFGRRAPSIYDYSTGQAIKDPTQNVIDSLNAAIQRVDDIMAIENRSIREVINEKIKRITDVVALRAEHAQALTLAESKRIDAIRIVDVNAVSIANERAAAQATLLQNQVSTSAETLRALVATTATTVAAQLAQTTAQITDRLSVLERAQYEFKGSSSVADPATSLALAQMAAAIKDLSTSAAKDLGKTVAKDDSWKSIGLVIAIIISIAAVLVPVLIGHHT